MATRLLRAQLFVWRIAYFLKRGFAEWAGARGNRRRHGQVDGPFRASRQRPRIISGHGWRRALTRDEVKGPQNVAGV